MYGSILSPSSLPGDFCSLNSTSTFMYSFCVCPTEFSFLPEHQQEFVYQNKGKLAVAIPREHNSHSLITISSQQSLNEESDLMGTFPIHNEMLIVQSYSGNHRFIESMGAMAMPCPEDIFCYTSLYPLVLEILSVLCCCLNHKSGDRAKHLGQNTLLSCILSTLTSYGCQHSTDHCNRKLISSRVGTVLIYRYQQER